MFRFFRSNLRPLCARYVDLPTQWARSLPNVLRTTRANEAINAPSTVLWLAADAEKTRAPDDAGSHDTPRVPLNSEAAARLKELRAEATECAGEPRAVVQRAAHLKEIYHHSAGNHTFPLIALHGALWGHNFIQFSEGVLGRYFAVRWFHKPREKQRRLSALWNYNNSVLAFNKQVFIDTWTSYYFSQEHPDLEMVASQDLGLPPDLARALLMVAQARQGSKPLSPEDKLAVFTASLLFEQDNVAQPVKELCEELDWPAHNKFCKTLMNDLLTQPIVRFHYFPYDLCFWFRNFSNRHERVARAVQSWHIAEQQGWDAVVDSVRSYGYDMSAHTLEQVAKPLRKSPRVPSLPFAGSTPFMLRVPSASGTGHVNGLDQMADAFKHFRERYGDIYRLDLPGVGAGVQGTLVVITDPREFTKVLKCEGEFPMGAIQTQWPVRTYAEHGFAHITQWWDRGARWKTYRRLMQKDLLATHRYLPGMRRAAGLASQSAPEFKDLGLFTARSSFDLFCMAMFGQLSETAAAATTATTTPGNARAQEQRRPDIYLPFCEDVLEIGTHVMPMIKSPYETVADRVGMTTARAQRLHSALDRANGHAASLIDGFIARARDGTLSEAERQSYLWHVLQRQQCQDDVSVTEVAELCQVFMVAAVDTTSALLNWIVLQLAIHPHIQDTLHQELKKAPPGTTPAYLHEVIRESHRMRPALPAFMFKSLDRDAELLGFHLPAKTVVLLDSHTLQNDPRIAESPDSFCPERWHPDQVKSRRGTPAEVLDHRLLRHAFSAGARMCPGWKLASTEVTCMITQLVLDWRFSVPAEQGITSIADVPYEHGFAVHPKSMPEFVFESRT